MEITADNINVSSDDPVVSRRTPAGDRAVTIRWLSKSRLPADHPWVTVRCPDGEQRMSVWPLVGFFPPITPQIPTSCRAAAGRWPGGARRAPADELICVTSADHPANFNCELKCSRHRPMTVGWALQECLFGRLPPDFCRIWCKTRRTVIRRSILLYCDLGFRWVIEQKKSVIFGASPDWGEGNDPYIYLWIMLSCYKPGWSRLTPNMGLEEMICLSQGGLLSPCASSSLLSYW